MNNTIVSNCGSPKVLAQADVSSAHNFHVYYSMFHFEVAHYTANDTLVNHQKYPNILIAFIHDSKH